ncbi:catalase-like domain-containing protein [Clohesyomyces aquaticus]|uniref:Catalase-like domain-containing protein n=1 Tax=Clohesyomyces aquaticus TaxID=1231657 RepID=A0A1Y2A3I0_9PLEO|nr:catalase-like domain-containing protein [Clohesyomyces aquaticus]
MSKKIGSPMYTLAEGRPIHDPSTSVIIQSSRSQRGGGLALLEDTQLIETLAHFPRERIPERVVHAKAAGAWGEFEVTHDITDFCSADLFSQVGKKTKVLARISTVAGEKGSSDTVRDIRGWALKFFTDEGNYDIVGNDLPVFFIRDPIKFPSLNRSHKRHPQTNVPNATMFWDFHNNNQEGIHCLMHLFGSRGIPASLRNINAYGVHTFKYGKPEEGTFKYVKIHFKPDDGINWLSTEDAARLAGQEPDYHVKDLFNAIERGDYPKWTLYLQVMDPKEAETYRWNIFDATQIWPHRDYPLVPVGKLTLNKNPENYFADVEQAAFSPSTMVPGIAPSADVMLQARMFSYPDAARYRVGPNYQQLPCNRAKYVYSPYQRDGAGTINGNYGGDPNYVRFSVRKISKGPIDVAHDEWVGRVSDYAADVVEDDFEQARMLWKIFLDEGEDTNFIKNVTGHLKGATPEVQKQTIQYFSKVDEEIGRHMEKELEILPYEGGAEHIKATQSAEGQK